MFYMQANKALKTVFQAALCKMFLEKSANCIGKNVKKVVLQ